MKKAKILFEGDFLYFWLMSLFLVFLTIITFGLAFPYAIYWKVKYFMQNSTLMIEDN